MGPENRGLVPGKNTRSAKRGRKDTEFRELGDEQDLAQKKRRKLITSTPEVLAKQKDAERDAEALLTGKSSKVEGIDAVKSVIGQLAFRSTKQEVLSDNTININSIKVEHIDYAITNLKRGHDKIEESRITDLRKKAQNQTEERLLREALQTLTELKKMIALPNISLEEHQSHWNAILEGKSTTLGTISSDNHYLKNAINDIKTAAHKEQNTGEIAQRTSEPVEQEPSPPPEAGSSMPGIPTFTISEID